MSLLRRTNAAAACAVLGLFAPTPGVAQQPAVTPAPAAVPATAAQSPAPGSAPAPVTVAPLPPPEAEDLRGDAEDVQTQTGPDLTLEAAIQRAITHSERAQIADMRILSAEAHVDKARSFFLPEVTLSGVYTRRLRGETRVTTPGPNGGPPQERVVQAADALNGALVIGVTLFDGRGFPLYRQASLERDATKLDAAEQRRTLAFDTCSLFIAALSQERVLRSAERRVLLAEQSARYARDRFEAGLASSNDVTQIELELSAAQRDLVAAQSEVRRSRIALGNVIDLDVQNQRLVVPRNLLTAADLSAEALSKHRKSEPSAGRFDIAAQRKRAEALDAAAEEPNWRWVPTLGLSGTGRATNEPGFSGNNLDASVALTLTWVLYDGGARYADRDDRLALARAAELEAQADARTARTDVAQAFVVLERGNSLREQAARTVEIARRNSQETGELYRQGLATALAVSDASVRLFSAEVELARARYDLVVGMLALRRALGFDPFGKEPAR